MIVGLNMHQASNAGLGHHHHPANLDHNLNGGSSSAAVGPPSTDRLSYAVDNSTGSAESYPIHHLHQYQHYESFNSSSQQSNHSILNSTVEAATRAPQQIYVPNDNQQPPQQSGMLGLEQQFSQFGLQTNQEEIADQTSSGHNLDIEGDEADEEPVKLFVGQIPKTMGEEDIFPTFNSFGPLKDVTVIRDKHTGIHRGCAFVTYWSPVDAETAREALHDKLIFPGAKRAAQVKPAEPSGMSSNASSSGGFYNSGQEYRIQETPIASADLIDEENKLFVGMLSRTCDEQEVRNLFSRFGEIHEVHLIRNADGSSKCASFLRFEHKESALQAIEQLNGVEVMDGAQRPLIVKFADTKHQRQQRHIRNIRRHEMVPMVGPGGYPYHPQGPLIPMGAHPGVTTQYPMPHAGPNHHPYGPGDYGHGNPGPHHYMYPPHYAAPIPQYAYAIPASHHPRSDPSSRPPMAAASSTAAPPTNPRPREGPAGANLFVYHLPHDLTDADLATAFNPFGNVISAKVYVDKFTGESKGFGFVSYDSVIAAEQAIEQMNGFQIGNKRLKVQHKRVHGSHGGGGGSQLVQIETESPTESE